MLAWLNGQGWRIHRDSEDSGKAVERWWESAHEVGEENFSWGDKIAKMLAAVEKRHLGLVRVWHEINDREKLIQVCEDPSVDLVELDVRWSRGRSVCRHNRKNGQGHGELTLQEAVEICCAGMERWQVGERAKPVIPKLDIKDERVLLDLRESGMGKRLDQSSSGCGFVINADVLRGPGGGKPKVSWESLGNTWAQYGNALLSMSFTTGIFGRGYSDEMVRRMAELTDQVDGEVLLPVKANYVRSFWSRFHKYFDPSKSYPYLWSWMSLKPEDIVWVEQNLPMGKYVMDIPDLAKERCFSCG